MKISSKSGKLVIFITRYLAYWFFSILRKTYRYSISGDSFQGKRCVYLLWHQNMIALLLLRAYEDNVVVISASFDGELIAAPSRMFGYIPARGSSSKKAVSLLKSMLGLAKEHSIAITPDGPKGPKYVIKDGAFFLAYMSKIPIIPISVKTGSKWQFNSWDQYIIPKPFSKIDVLYHPAVYVDDKEAIPELIAKVTAQMTKDF